MGTSRNFLSDEPRHDAVCVEAMLTCEQHCALIILELGKAYPAFIHSNPHEREFELHPPIFHHAPPLNLDQTDIQVKFWASYGRACGTEDFAHREQLLIVGSLAGGLILLQTRNKQIQICVFKIVCKSGRRGRGGHLIQRI